MTEKLLEKEVLKIGGYRAIPDEEKAYMDGTHELFL